MTITRHNYEEYFLLYVDNELTTIEREAVENFVAENPDLKNELMMLQNTVVPAEKAPTLGDKSFLFRTTAISDTVNETNCEEYFVLYSDDELSNEEKAATEQFVYKNPQYQVAFELIQKVHYTADTSILFPGKSSLYRYEKDEKVIVFRWWRVAAAAAIVLFLGISAWVYLSAPKNENSLVTGTKDPAITHPIVTAPATKEETIQKNLLAEKDIKSNPPETNREKSNPAVRIVSSQEKKTNLLAIIDKPVIKSSTDSNFSTDSDVTLKGSMIAKIDEKEKNNQVINTGIAAANPLPDSPAGPENTNSNYLADNTDSNKDNFAVLTSNISSKNKMRGFFRKVTRVVEKATNIGSGDNNKGIHIANFEIALK